MSNRPKISYEQTLDLSVAELNAYGVKSALSYDTYGNDYEFMVRVLTRPIPMRTSDIKAFFSPVQPQSSPTQPGGSQTNQSFPEKTNMSPANPSPRDRSVINSFSFMGRIEDSRDRPSPHRFIPDPGDSCLFETDKEKREAIIQHTNFCSNEGFNGPIPKVGDVVRVRLEPGDISFNLQQAFFNTIVILANGQSYVSPYSTISAAGIFKGRRAEVSDYAYRPKIATYDGMMESMKGQTITNGKLPMSILADVNTTYSDPGVVLVDILEDYDKLAQYYYESGSVGLFGEHRKFPITQCYRFFETQVKIYEDPKKVNKEGKHLGAYPGTSLHGWGFAVDFQSWDGKVKGFESEIYKWFYNDGKGRFNFKNPSWARPNGSKPEAWHFEHQKINKKKIKNIRRQKKKKKK